MSTAISDTPAQYKPSVNAGYAQDSFDGPVLTADILMDGIMRFMIDVAQRTLSTPAERLKLLTTVEGELKRQGRLPSVTGFGGVFGCMRRVWRKEGFLGFFRGALADVVLSLPAGLVDALSMNIVFRLSHAVLPRRFSEEMGLRSALVITLGVTALTVLVALPYFSLRRSILTNYMADLIAPAPCFDSSWGDLPRPSKGPPEEQEDKMNTSTTEGYIYTTATQTTASIYRRQGLRAFYRGALVSPILATVYRALYFGASFLIPEQVQRVHPYCVVGMLSFVSDIVMQPLEVVERRLSLSASNDLNEPYKGILDCAGTIVREEGVCALWSGLRCRFVMNILGLAIRVMLANVFAES